MMKNEKCINCSSTNLKPTIDKNINPPRKWFECLDCGKLFYIDNNGVRIGARRVITR